MNPLLRPAPILALLVALVFLALGQYGAAGICLVALIGTLAIGAARQTTSVRQADLQDRMDLDSRTLYVAVRKGESEIRELIDRHRNTPTIQAIGPEVLREAGRIREQAGKALVARTDLRKALKSRSNAESELEALESRRLGAESSAERDSLGLAVNARRMEIDQYVRVDAALIQIEAGVRDAQSALSEMRSTLAIRLAGARADTPEEGDVLRDSIGRLHALNISFDEVDQLLHDA